MQACRGRSRIQRWLVERWLERLGPEATQRWTAFNNEPAPLTLRVNRLKHDS